MSESEYESFVGNITTFYAPSLFWFISEEQISIRNNFNDKLNNTELSFECIEKVSVGQKVIIKYEEWVRAEIADIKQNETNNREYICWLLDYGIFVIATKIYKLPDEPKLVPPFAQKVMLYGLQSIILNFDFGARALQEHRETEWVPGIRRCVTDILKIPKIIQTFRKRFKFEDYLIGDVCIQHPKEGIFDLGEKIIANGLAKFDEPSFLASLQLIKMVEKSLSTVYMQTRYYSDQDLSKILENQKRSRGRATFRSVDTYVKDRRKKPKDIPSSFFCDADNDISIPEQKQVKSFKEKKEPVSGKGRGKKFRDLLNSKRQASTSGNESDCSKEDKDSNKSISPSGRGFSKHKNHVVNSKTDAADSKEGQSGTNKEEMSVFNALKKTYIGRGFLQSTESTQIEQKKYEVEDYTKFQDAENKVYSTVLENVYPSGLIKNRSKKNLNQITSENNFTEENTVTAGRGFTKSTSPEAVHISLKSSLSRGLSLKNKVSFEDDSGFKKSSENENSGNVSEIKSSGRGFNMSPDLSTSSSFESENSSQNKSMGRGFKKSSKYTSLDYENFGNGGQIKSSDSENINLSTLSENIREMKSAGRGFAKSPPSSSSSEYEVINSPYENDEFKSSGRGFKKYTTKSQISINSDDPFDHGDEVESNQTDESEPKKISLYRKSSPVRDVFNCQPAGANISPKSSKDTNNQDFQCTINQKRPPIEETSKTVVDSVKTFNDTFKNDKNDLKVQHKKIAGLCDCQDCIEWRNNNKVFEPVVIEPRKPKEQKVIIKPPLLFKTLDQEEIKFKIHTERIFTNDTEKLAAPRLLVHGYLRAEPASDLPHIPFDENVQMALRQMNYANAYSIQTYAWPAILRGHSVILVSVPECGKTMVYVPTLCHFTFNKNPFLPEGNGPISIILCPRVKIVETVFRIFKTVLMKSRMDTKVQAVVQLYEKVTVIRLERGADILITTPRLLIKMLKRKLFSLNRLCHVVLDEAQDLFSLFPSEIDYIFKKTQRVLENRIDCIPIQLITVSQEWTKPIEDFAKKFRIPPLICIGAHLEAALYGKAEIKVQLSNSSEKTVKLIEIIKDIANVRKTIIMCNDTDDAKELLNYLNTHGIIFETLLSESAIEEINAIKKRWFNSIPGRYFVLVCSDNIFNTGLALTDAEVMVQYSLPENWSQFTFRFSGFLDKYSPLAVKKEDRSRCLMHIIIDDTNIKEFPRMLQFLQRMGTKLTQSLIDFYYQLTGEMEEERLENKISLCDELLCFGSCRNIISCKYRHMLSRKTDISSTLPQSGLIKMKILYTLNPMKHFARLISHTDSNNITRKISDDYIAIASHLLALKDARHKFPVIKLQVGALCAVEETDGLSKGTIQRCKVLDVVKHGSHIKKVLVHFIDLGSEKYVLTSHLLYLPENLKDIPAQAVPIYISNIGPPDKDLTWPGRTTILLMRAFKSAGYSHINCSFTGRIKLQIGDGFLVDDLKLEEILDDGDLVVYKLSVRDTLNGMTVLEERPEHLEKLYEHCEKYNIPLHDYTLPVIKVIKKIEPQVKPTWAHLENMEEFNTVYFCMALSPETFFVKLCKNTSCLEQLNKDIVQAMNKPFYRSVVSAYEGRCYLVKDPVDSIYARAMVKNLKTNTAECFFVDYGDNIEVAISELKYLPDDLITQLPFQAIECKLHGIEPSNIDQIWMSEATDIFYDVANEPNTDILRYLHVKVMDDGKAQFTGYKKYSVVLLDTFEQDTVINNLLLDLGYAVQINDERIEIDFDKLKLKNCDTESVEDSDEDITKYQSNLGDLPEYDEVQSQNGMNEIDDNSFDFSVSDLNDFMRELFPKGNLASMLNTPKLENNSQDISTNLKALPMPSPGFSTPNIVWQQTKSNVTLRIEIPSVTEYEVKVLRSRMLAFKTSCSGIDYRVDLNLFAKIDSNVEHSNRGLYVAIKMKKIIEEEWPRLVISTEKQRYIVYNVASITIDDDSDDEKPLSKEKIESSKQLGEELHKDDENAPFSFEYGSDIDWSESDVDSERDSDST